MSANPLLFMVENITVVYLIMPDAAELVFCFLSNCLYNLITAGFTHHCIKNMPLSSKKVAKW